MKKSEQILKLNKLKKFLRENNIEMETSDDELIIILVEDKLTSPEYVVVGDYLSIEEEWILMKVTGNKPKDSDYITIWN